MWCAVAIPIAIFVVCLAIGVYAASRWLPELASGTVGGLGYLVVCGLVGAAAGVFGLRIYNIVEILEETGIRSLRNQGLALGLETLLFDTGLLLGLAPASICSRPREPGRSASRGNARAVPGRGRSPERRTRARRRFGPATSRGTS